jgi:hypothetical protein
MRQERERWEVLSVRWKMILIRFSAVICSVYSILGIENVGSSETLVLHNVIPKIPSYVIISFPIYRQNDIDYSNIYYDASHSVCRPT